MPTATGGRTRRLNRGLELLAYHAARWSSSSAGFATALAIILIWLALRPFLRYSDSWQLWINTGTTIVTFLMVFLIQRSQSKDALAIQLNLDEIVAALAGASNKLVSAEDPPPRRPHRLRGTNDRDKSLAAGFDRHITKPTNPELLRRLLDGEPTRRTKRADATR